MPRPRRWSGRRPRLGATNVRVRCCCESSAASSARSLLRTHALVPSTPSRNGVAPMLAGLRPPRGAGWCVDVAGDRGQPDSLVAAGQRQAAGRALDGATVGGLTRPSLTVTVSPEKPRPTTAAFWFRARADGGAARPATSASSPEPRCTTATAWSSTERTQTTSSSASIWAGETGSATESTTEALSRIHGDESRAGELADGIGGRVSGGVVEPSPRERRDHGDDDGGDDGQVPPSTAR